MSETLMRFIIVCPMTFAAGFVDSIAGGGGLISLPAYLIAGLPAHTAIATNKMSSSMGTAMAVLRYASEKYILWKIAALCAICAYAGSFTGAKLSLLIDEHLLKVLMLFIIPLTALYTQSRHSFSADGQTKFSTAKTAALCAAAVFIIGMYDGFYGPGTGTFLLLTLTGLAHMRLNEANGMAKFINLMTNIAALLIFLRAGKVDIALGVTAGAFSIAGNYIGASFFTKRGAEAVRPLVFIVLTIFFIKILTELF